MKIFKRILLVIGVLVALFFIIPLFVDGTLKSVKEITINKPKQQVYDYVVLLKNQDNFSKWAKMDPNMKKEYKGVDGTVGFVSAWDSENGDVGKGEQTIMAIKPGERIDYDLHFIKPFDSKATCYISFKELDSVNTKVTWGFNSKMAYPFNIMTLFTNMNEMIGKDFEEGLNNLKAILEK